MRLVIVTNEYPYGKQEAFLEEEIKVLEQFFEEIHIYSYAEQETNNTRYVPENAQIIRVKNKDNIAKLLGWLSLLSPICIKEILFSRKAFSYSSLRRTIPILARYYNYSGLILPSVLKNETTEDTIFYSYWLSHQAYGLSKFKKKHKNAFCIARAHGVDNFIERGLSFYRRELLQSLNCIYPISNLGVKELLDKVCKYSRSNCTIKTMQLGVKVPNGKKMHSKKGDTFVLCSCSFINAIKRLDIIIDALCQMDDIDITWIHFGGGELEKDIRRMAEKKFSFKKNIHHKFYGQTSHEKILEYYQTNFIDLFVNASDNEGIPVSIMEAMAHSIPCVARNVGGNCEIINEDNGYLLSKNAGAADYAEVFRKHYGKSLQSIENMRKNAYDFIETQYNADKVHVRFVKEMIREYYNNKRK